jgi:thiol-disulfide isomerase/thioredoxin
MRSDFKIAIIFGIIIVISIAGINYVFSSVEITPMDSTIITQDKIIDGLNIVNIDKSKFKQAPSLVGIADYINTTPEELEKAMEGKVVLYDIWTYSCINCIRTLPFLTAWDEKYSDEGLLIIGIHSPEFEFEKDVNNVQMAVNKYGIKYPVVLDNDKDMWKAFKNRYWPHKFIADSEGNLRYDHIGEGRYVETEKIIQQLLKERNTKLGLEMAAAEPFVEIEEFKHTSFRTPELYFGYKFASGRNQLGNEQGFIQESDVVYSSPNKLEKNYFYLDGTWRNLQGSMKLVSENGIISLPYFAKEVNIVTANASELSIYIDDNPITSDLAGVDIDDNGKILVYEDGLYNIIKSEEAESHLLKIVVSEPGFEIYAFTFG